MTNLNIDIRLINTRKELAIKEIKVQSLSKYDERSAMIRLDWKVEVLTEALTSLHDLGVAHNCSISNLWDEFEGIAKLGR